MPLEIPANEYHHWLHFNQLAYGFLLIDGGGSTLTLTDHQARFKILHIANSAEVIVPAFDKAWIIRNTTASQIIVKTAAGATVAIDAGDAVFVACDGVNCYAAS